VAVKSAPVVSKSEGARSMLVRDWKELISARY